MAVWAAPVMCIILGTLEPYAIIGLILLHYGAAAAEVALSDGGELETRKMTERASGFRRAVTHPGGVGRSAGLMHRR